MNQAARVMLLAVALCSFAYGADKGALERMEWQIEGVTRDALIYVPVNAKEQDTPLLFDFHGHGGTAKNAATRHNFQQRWPEAMVVYMQGLPTAGKTDPQGVKPGWQARVGDLNDRDLKFFDAVLEKLKKDYKIDAARIYCTGHSNGAVFTYDLWSARGATFAAVAPVAGVALGGFNGAKPLPVLHIAGESDPVVPFRFQQATVNSAKTLNGCDATGVPWMTSGALVGTEFKSKAGAAVVSVVFPGGHTYPDEAPEMIVKFFKEHHKP